MRRTVTRAAAGVSAGLLAAVGIFTVGVLPASAAIGAYTPSAGIPNAPATPNEVVDTTGSVNASCGLGLAGGSEPVFTTIDAAIAAATAGDTIYVCAGNYGESVTPTKDLVIDGAQWSADAVGRTGVPESNVTPPVNDSAVVYGGSATTGTLNGFTLTGTPVTLANQEADGILAIGSGNLGFTWENNVITGFTNGINFFASGAGSSATFIHDNSFVNNDNDPSLGDSGQGIFFTNGASNNVTITNNSFSGDNSGPAGGDCDINTTGSGTGTVQTGLVIEDNTSSGAGNFLVIFETSGALIENNTVTGNTSSAFFIDGANNNDTFSGNTISGGVGPDSKGFRFTSFFGYGPSGDLTVENNNISGEVDGIVGNAPDDGTLITGNTITGSTTDGVLMSAGPPAATDYTFSNNTISGSGSYDILDLTTGTGTGGTGNFYDDNHATTVSPSGTLAASPTFTADTPPLQVAPGGTYSYTFVASGLPTPTYTLVGAPSFLSINSTTGAVTGVAPSSGTDFFTYAVTATNGVNPPATTATFTVAVTTSTGTGGGGGGGTGGGTGTDGTGTGGTGTSPSAGAYDLVGSDGGVFVFGQPGTGFYGSLPGMNIHVKNIVGIVPTTDGKGYFLVGSDGGVFAFGDAPFENSLPGEHVSVNDIVGIVPTKDDKGYFLVGRDGGVFAFGDAPFENSLPGQGTHVNNIVGIAATPDNGGYWVVASSGQVYALGDAKTYGSATSGPVVAITATPDGGGYWLTTANGGVDTFGDAGFYKSLPGINVNVSNIVSLVPSTDGKGYLLVGADGGLFAFGDATFPGSLPGLGVHVTNIVGAVPVA